MVYGILFNMRTDILFLLLIIVLPLSVSAQGVNDYLTNFALFTNSTLIPFLFGIAFLFFVINVIRFFVVQSSNEDGREKARSLITYSVLAFVFLTIFWGMINLFTSSLGFTNISATNVPCSDYMNDNGTNCKSDPSVQTGGGGNLDTGGFGSGAGMNNDDPFVSGAYTPGGSSNSDASGAYTPSGSPATEAPTLTPPQTDHDSLPTVSTDMINAADDAAATKEKVATIVNDFIAALPDIYDWRTTSVIEGAVAAIDDPAASNQEKIKAAIRLANNDLMTNGDLVKYTAVVNVEQQAAGEPKLDLVQLRAEAVQPTEHLQGQIEYTKQAMLPIIAESHQGWFDWGEPNADAAQAAQRDLNYIYSDDLSATQRIGAFDNVVTQGGLTGDPTVVALRTQLINDTNGELFFAGKNPLMVPNQPLNTPGPNSDK